MVHCSCDKLNVLETLAGKNALYSDDGLPERSDSREGQFDKEQRSKSKTALWEKRLLSRMH